ncbi:acyl-CoA thioesterase [Qipengyuania flava]|uniref:acyl-CoA thioesterase n=1 Tax=Qipengyuania flava TaxID=192812 RepID=UPI001C57A0DC|nr:acyl-CoA thioesterase domain-containing protein [Qipengyuania flava]MBW3167777.1 thioesterase family protein [Qipengyuania flava]MBY5965015.1 thioesterase family protein [Qipengyuania flava]MBY6011339.1 thioesterase family protein [Qipengyuania flava]MBY6025781.1 thioesterase family protein [Qipengyuania flava]
MGREQTAEELVAGFIRLLTVSREGDDAFTGRMQPDGIGRVFGGQVIAQALQAAQATAPDGLEAHSLHAYFLRGGKEGVDIDYATARDFDGRSFANRRVVASQTDEDGKPRPILNLTASFQRPEDGLAHDDVTIPDVTPPEDLRSDMEMRHKLVESAGDKMSEAQRNLVLRPRPIDMRTVDRLHWMNSEPREPRAHSWFRTVAPLPSIEENPALHRAVIAYASDYTLLGTSALPHGLSWMRGELVGASLDHAIWFHRPARADEWLLYATDAPWSGGGRGFNRGRIFNRQGELVASVAQEGMMRRRKGP